MSMDFVFAAIARPALAPSNLNHKRRVNRATACEASNNTKSREEKYRLEDEVYDEQSYLDKDNNEKSSVGGRIDDIV